MIPLCKYNQILQEEKASNLSLFSYYSVFSSKTCLILDL